MTAGMAAKMMLIEAIRQRPASSLRSSRSTRRAEEAVNRSTSAGPVPRVLASCTPLIESPSSTVTLRSASSRCRCGGDLAAHPGDPAGQPDGRRQHHERDQGELPGERDHGDRGGDHGGEVGRDGGGGGGDHRLHAADVVGDAGLHLAGAGAGEEAERLALQVAEDVGAQPVHDLLADLGGDPGLHDAEGGGHRGDGDHADDQPDQQRSRRAAAGRRSITARSRNGRGHRDASRRPR